MRFTTLAAVALGLVASFAASPVRTAAEQSPGPASDVAPTRVVVVTRHGVRSPTDPTELAPYVATTWPTWEVPPGDLTPRGASLMTTFGAAYRTTYAALRPFSAAGCPSRDDVVLYADLDERTRATARALAEGLAPGCRLAVRTASGDVDPIFHAVPALGTVDRRRARDAVAGAVGDRPDALVLAYASAYARLDRLLGCDDGPRACRPLSREPATFVTSSKTGLTTVAGPLDLASTAVEDLILAYADGKPLARIGSQDVDEPALRALSQLHILKFAVDTQPPYVAAVQGSNLLSHVMRALDGTSSLIPASTAFVAFVGHDTNLAALGAMLRIHWLLPGYERDDTPPGGALVFEVYGSNEHPTVRTYFTAQTLDQMRMLSPDVPARVPVFVPGCPSLDCPLATFERIVATTVDPAFVAP